MKKTDAPPRLLVLMKQAAELRALGASWEMVGRQIRRSPRAVRRWPERYAADWSGLLREAQDTLLAQLAGESASVLRKLLHANADWIGQNTGKFFLSLFHTVRRRNDAAMAGTGIDPKYAPILVLLETMNEDERKAFVMDWV